ncbi:CinA family protein [Gammaproteobacteria bacterium]|jgi:nicotinamide-nucleotide amidase|nr:CinA family protein [Gammaproteobacteria bacterium]MDC1073092.1 CinA family protein [Gammaproteobacteria bacterium]MDC1097852.1 CinA family protein [Gammaproteobacteria bacterium]
MRSELETVSQLATVLVDRDWRLATVESCTGGSIAQLLTSVAGSSEWFECGLVTYSNRSKTELAGVPEHLIDQYGAVSEKVACAMASGAISRTAATAALSVTGVAGPSGGSATKPVGTVYIAWQFPGLPVRAERFHFHGDRDAVRRQSVNIALEELLRLMSTTV